MKAYLIAAAALAGAWTMTAPSPSLARDYPVCLQGGYRAGGEGDTVRCEYDNLGQCRASAVGNGGVCIANPLYASQPLNEPRPRYRQR